MNTHPHTLRALGAGFAALALTAVASAPSAAAAEGDVEVVNTETVQVYMSPEGEIETQRVYEQLTLTGTGTAEVANPIEEQGLRNLDGFSGFSVEDGVQNVEVDVDGVQRLRSVSDFSGDLPLDISIEYRLDGSLVEPADVVGADGELEVLFTVRNVTAQTQEVSFPDGQGGTITEMAEVPIPMVGSLTTTAPSNFTEVSSGQANMAGDGKGGTKLTFTMTLFPPLGSDEISFGYTANITDGVVPSSSVSALPVNPLESTSFKAAGESYQAGSDTGIKLAEGATEIDTNLLKLRDGAATLLNGLMQLSDGADQLNAGLAGEAAPGSVQLADGAVALKNGLGQIDAGAGELADGAGRLSDGAGQLDDGAGRLAAGLTEAGDKAPALLDGVKKIRAGLVKVDDGLGQLYAGVDAVRDNPRYQELLDGLDRMIAGLGDKSTAGTIIWGVDQLRTKLRAAVPGVMTMQSGAECAAKTVNLLNNGVAAVDADDACFDPIKAQLAQVNPALTLASLGSEADPLRSAVMSGLQLKLSDPEGHLTGPSLHDGLSLLLSDLTRQSASDPGAILALTAVSCGLDSSIYDGTADAGTCAAIGRPGPGLRQGLGLVAAGVPELVNTIIGSVQGAIGQASDTPQDGTLRGGMSGLIDGVDQLGAGGADLLAGLGLLADGAGQLADGTGELSSGAGELSAGADKLAAGTGEASDGSQQLADGAGRLADGLGEAADGSGRLADGLDQAAQGAPKLVDGAGRLSDEGMSQLIAAGEDTAQDYGKLYAVIEAGAERADAERMAYGAPENAQGLTAYTYELLGDDGSGSRNTQRGLGALALLGLGGGAFALRRRFI